MKATESAYSRTEAGLIEVKTLPAGRLIEHTAASRSYFDASNGLFGSLFRYIQSHNISMTTPVEAKIEPGSMRFWISEKQREKADSHDGAVRVIDVPERRVAAIGGTGAYSRQNFEIARKALMDWISQQGNLKPVGEPFAAYWDGPMTPWFMKKFEVLVEVSILSEE